MSTVTDRLLGLPEVANDPLLRELAAALSLPTGTSSAGYPYLQRVAWARVRDWVPHTLGAGLRVWRAVDRLEGLAGDDAASLADGLRVVRQVVRTAAITAPPDLWLVRQVLSAMKGTGWLDRLAEGVDDVPDGLRPDLSLLLARGYLVRCGDGWAWGETPTAQRVLAAATELPAAWPADLSRRWADALTGATDDADRLAEVATLPDVDDGHVPPAWVASPRDLELGWRLVPLVLGLRAADRIDALLEAGRVDVDGLAPLGRPAAEAAVAVLTAAGALAGGAITPVGARMLQRGPGPFGIIEAYHPYLAQLPTLWSEGRGAVHVERSANVAASQDANRHTFQRANDALDRFCADTGFSFTVFVEHAVGRGEATRQRWERSGDQLAYVGADLEDAAIDAAMAEQAAGRLPPGMIFVRHADIARPDVLVDAMAEAGLSTEGAVMLVGNGFHEVRDPTDATMVEVFAGYERAGFVLLFTEENALAVDDLLNTAWNTYHAGFKYVHERSGQGLRPASPRPPSKLGQPLPTSWTECATRAGYVRMDAYCGRTRTIYPYTPASGHNPAISVNHFFVPARLVP